MDDIQVNFFVPSQKKEEPKKETVSKNSKRGS